MDKAMKTFNNHLNPIFTQSGDVALDYVQKEQGRMMDLAANGRKNREASLGLSKDGDALAQRHRQPPGASAGEVRAVIELTAYIMQRLDTDR